MLQPAGKRQDVIDESMHLLEALKLADHAQHRVSELPYGRQRLVELAIALGLKPEVLLLDEPAAGVPSAESHIILDAIEALPAHIGVLIIEHDMDVVFRFAERITVMVGGAIFAEGTPQEIAKDERVRAVYLGQEAHAAVHRHAQREARPWRDFALELEDVSAGYGETVVLEEVRLALGRRDASASSAATASARPRCWRPSWATPRCTAGDLRLHGRSIGRLSTYRRAWAGLGYVPQEREIFPSLTVRENLEVAARPGHWTIAEVFRTVSEARRRARTIAAISSPAASSRCCRSPARWSPIRRCC